MAEGCGCLILLVAFLAVLYSSGGGTLATLIIVLLLLAALLAGQIEEAKKSKEELKRKEEEAAEAAAEAAEKARHEEWLKEYVEENGQPDRVLVLEEEVVWLDGRFILLHKDKQQICLDGSHYHFRDILGCVIHDDCTVEKGDTTSVTRTDVNVGAMIVGGLIAGEAGAIVGGLSGDKVTTTHHENDEVTHDYTVIINVNSLDEPVVRLHTGENLELTQEIAGLIGVILARNNAICPSRDAGEPLEAHIHEPTPDPKALEKDQAKLLPFKKD